MGLGMGLRVICFGYLDNEVSQKSLHVHTVQKVTSPSILSVDIRACVRV